MEISANPVLVPIPGDVVGSPPYMAEGCLMQTFLLEGDRTMQQKLCDRLINQPSGGALQFEVLSNTLMMNVLYIDTLRSLSPVDGPKGVIEERDLGFWIGVFGGPTQRPTEWRAMWLPAFLFVDTPSAMASGREVFGYPKTLARWHRPRSAAEDASLILEVQHYPVFGSAARPLEQVLLRIEQTLSTDVMTAASTTPDTAFWQKTGLASQLRPDGPAAEAKLSLSMPQLLFRQARDPVALGTASFIQILALDVVVLGLPRRIGTLPGDLRVIVSPSESHPIAQTLGIAATSVPLAAFWAQQDFEVGAATVLWSTP